MLQISSRARAASASTLTGTVISERIAETAVTRKGVQRRPAPPTCSPAPTATVSVVSGCVTEKMTVEISLTRQVARWCHAHQDGSSVATRICVLCRRGSATKMMTAVKIGMKMLLCAATARVQMQEISAVHKEGVFLPTGAVMEMTTVVTTVTSPSVISIETYLAVRTSSAVAMVI